jgi:hypothetical protein
VELIRELKHHAVDTEQSLSGLVTTALTEYLAHPNRAPAKKGNRRGH